MPKKLLRARPLTVEAIEFTGDNGAEILAEFPEHADWDGTFLEVWTGNDWVTVNVGDTVLRDTAGLPYPCKPAVLAAKYEEI